MIAGGFPFAGAVLTTVTAPTTVPTVCLLSVAAAVCLRALAAAVLTIVIRQVTERERERERTTAAAAAAWAAVPAPAASGAAGLEGRCPRPAALLQHVWDVFSALSLHVFSSVRALLQNAWDFV